MASRSSNITISTGADLLDALEDFKKAADESTVALAYYAGHGMEIGGKNVIAPTDMEIDCDDQEARRAVEADKLFEALGGAPQQIVLLDACRNNPFPQCPKRSATLRQRLPRLQPRDARPSSRCSSPTPPSPASSPPTAPPAAHSPFASALLARFEANPKMFIRDLLDQTAADVQLASGGSQVPEITTRGGAPKICLSEDGCGGDAGPGPKEPATPGGKVVPQQAKEHNPGDCFADCTDGCPEMVAVAAGSFLMGAGKDDERARRARSRSMRSASPPRSRCRNTRSPSTIGRPARSRAAATATCRRTAAGAAASGR